MNTNAVVPYLHDVEDLLLRRVEATGDFGTEVGGHKRDTEVTVNLHI